jgi:hypothetical protein
MLDLLDILSTILVGDMSDVIHPPYLLPLERNAFGVLQGGMGGGSPAVSEFAGVSPITVTVVSFENMIYTLPEPVKGLMSVIFVC